MITAWVYNSLGCLVGAFERDEFETACSLVKDDDKVRLEREIYEGNHLTDLDDEEITGAEFVELYGRGV